MKFIFYILLFPLLSINAIETTGYKYNLFLNDQKSVLDGIPLTSIETNGVTYNDGIIEITLEGTYILSGTLNGQIKINSTGTVILVLNGVSIKNSDSNAIIFEKAYELDPSKNIKVRPEKDLDISKAGAQIIIADGTENTIDGGYQEEKNGAIHSDVSILITGEEKGDGILNVIGSNEGIETNKHLFFSGGILKIASQEDGINASKALSCTIIIIGGKLLINAGLDLSGDGVDSNGYILVEGGEIISAGHVREDSGLDASQDLIINGGSVFSVGSSMDMASSLSCQPTMNLLFKDSIDSTSIITVKDSDGNEIISFSADSADFISGSERRNFFAAVVSHPSFKAEGVYHLFIDGIQSGFTGHETRLGYGSNSGYIITDFTLGSSTTYFSGIQKIL